jgi:hypothetical protein
MFAFGQASASDGDWDVVTYGLGEEMSIYCM